MKKFWEGTTFVGTKDQAKKLRDVLSDEIRHLEKQQKDLRERLLELTRVINSED